MKPAGARRSKVDGGWWPRSAELAKELPSLAHCLEQRVGLVTRVGYHLEAWGLAEREVRLGGRTVRLEGFRSTDPDMITVIGTDSRWVHLLVIRPEAPGGVARAVLRSASDGDSTATSAEILFGNGVASGAETADPLESTS
ncbi:DUF5994 family protein [Amycolatopsis circi]|uniref:DUF5994 family protein n=1 Tax=Amycolatopsis circi TaxID=871959 RepID=UPI001ABFDA11|nr:DUF5994 family protein [Amycolatopsis circi]